MRPTRAEVSDVSAAVFDGTDAVMLSGETTMGKYPIDTVRYMAEICENAEKFYSNDFNYGEAKTVSETVTRGVVEAAKNENVKLIVTYTMTGLTARRISNLKPSCPILARCSNEKTARSLALNYGVYSIVSDLSDDMDEIVSSSKNDSKKYFNLIKGDEIIITAGLNNKTDKKDTNFMKVEELD